MSKLVIMEGWIKQKNKNKELVEVYAVLTQPYLKIYKSQINFKQRPDEALKVLNLSDSYNILPVLFDNEFTFSIFKKGERAADRLYLNASSKSDYETWLKQIEDVLNPKSKENESGCANGGNTTSESKKSTEQVDKVSTLKSSFQAKSSSSFHSAATRSEHKNPQEKNQKSETDSNKTDLLMEGLVKENEKLKTDLENCKKELVKLKESTEKATSDQLQSGSQMEAKLKKANDEILRLRIDKQGVNDKKMGLEKEIEKLKKSMKENNELDQAQSNKIVADLSTKVQSANIDLSSYMFCIDNLVEQNKQSTILETLLKTQLVNFVHRCPIDLNTNVTLHDYLTVNIDLSQNSIIQFLTKLLISLSNCINKSEPPKSDLDPKIVTVIRNIVTMTKVSQKIDPKLNLYQTLLEIAYLLTKRNCFKAQFSNGLVNDASNGIENQFDNFLKSHKLEAIKKVVIIELGLQIKEKYQSKSIDKESARKPEISKKTEPILQSYLTKKWNDTLKKLDQKELEIKDLYITIQELSNRIITLECENYDNNPMFPLDEIFNIYSMNADVLCGTCQKQASDLLEMPIIRKIDVMASDFQSYWKTILNVHSLLNTKQQYNSGLRDLFEKMTQSTQEFENLMRQFREVTRRSVENPTLIKPSPISNDH